MSSINGDVERFLAHYWNFQHAPHFAVLLKGPWGVGKTHIVKRFLARQQSQTNSQPAAKPLYVSLYGVTSFTEIEEAFFQQLHPILSSKGMKLVASVAKGLLRTTVKIDFDKSGPIGGTVSSQMPDINLPSYLMDGRDRVLVFDDLERCSIPTKDLLGYVNSLVEHDDRKVILIANEDEILARDDGTFYAELKEKVIGKTLEIRPEFEDAVGRFTSFVDDLKLREFYTVKRSDIQILFAQSETENLRVLQQTMWDFERFVGALTDAHRKNMDGMAALIRVFFALSFELKVGRLSNDELFGFKEISWFEVFSDDDGEKHPMQRLRKRYPEVDFDGIPLGWSILADVLVRSVIDASAIQQSLACHKYFLSPESEPAWRVLWHARTKSDSEVDAAIERVEREFSERRFTNPSVIMHVCGIRLWLARTSAIPKDQQTIVLESKAYIDALYRDGQLVSDGEISFDGRSRPIGSGGLGFHENETSEFQTIHDYLTQQVAAALEATYPGKAKQLMAEMSKSPEMFLQRVNATNSPENHFASLPILVHIDPSEFVDRVFALPREGQRTVFMALNARYEHHHIGGRLGSEISWLRKVCDVLSERVPTMHPVAGETIQSWVKRYRQKVIGEISDG